MIIIVILRCDVRLATWTRFLQRLSGPVQFVQHIGVGLINAIDYIQHIGWIISIQLRPVFGHGKVGFVYGSATKERDHKQVA